LTGFIFLDIYLLVLVS